MGEKSKNYPQSEVVSYLSVYDVMVIVFPLVKFLVIYRKHVES